MAALNVHLAGPTERWPGHPGLAGLHAPANRNYPTEGRVVYALMHEGIALQVRAPDAERANEADETRVSCRWARFAGQLH
ncbi:MAG: hypothetical protein AB7N24_23595 [Dehalococcoidia bacterium]